MSDSIERHIVVGNTYDVARRYCVDWGLPVPPTAVEVDGVRLVTTIVTPSNPEVIRGLVGGTVHYCVDSTAAPWPPEAWDYAHLLLRAAGARFPTQGDPEDEPTP